MKEGITRKSQSTEIENRNRREFTELLRECPIPKEQLVWHTSLFINRIILTRMLCFEAIYKKILNIPGVIMQFGVFYGRDLPLLINLRGIFEPFKYTRKIIGFDTFEGFLDLDPKDGDHAIKGDFSVLEGYEEYLEKMLRYHEQECPLNHIKKFELVRGNVATTLFEYLRDNPETIIALAYLDLDLYEPTKNVLNDIEPYLVKGSIIVFDELNFKLFPGETIAFRESRFSKLKIHSFPYEPTISYVVWE